MATEFENPSVEENEKEDSREKMEITPKKSHGKLKAFIIGAIATLGIGVVHTAKVAEKEKQAKEWKTINSDADSIYIDTDEGKFYAEKKLSKEDKQEIKKLQAVKDSLLERRAKIIEQAGKDFTKALNNRDVEGMKKAIANKAENINAPNQKGQTPLMQLLEDIESSKSYICARELIPHADLGAKDHNGATVADYAAIINNLKGQVIQREIDAEKQARAKRAEEEKRERSYRPFDSNKAKEEPVFRYIEITKTETGYDEVAYFSDGEIHSCSVKASPEEADKKIKEANDLNTVAKVDNAINGVEIGILMIDGKTYRATADKSGWDVRYGKNNIRKDVQGSWIFQGVNKSSKSGKVMEFYEEHIR